jgi:hypothetical protein
MIATVDDIEVNAVKRVRRQDYGCLLVGDRDDICH